MRKRVAFAGIFAPNFERACEFLIKNSRGAFSPEVFPEHFYAYIIISEVLSESARSAFSRKTDDISNEKSKNASFCKNPYGFSSF